MFKKSTFWTVSESMSLLTLAFFLAIGLSVNAKPVSEQEARQKALSFVSERMNSNLSVVLSHSAAAKRIKQKDTFTPYYIYKVGQNESFVIVAGDDRAGDILGYGDLNVSEGVAEAMPDNMVSFLNAIEEEIVYLVDNDLTAYDVKAAAAAAGRRLPARIDALCKSRWGQDNPYNLYTPTVNGQKTPSGCVATAMAQVMYFHKWPQEPTAPISGYTMRSSGKTLDDLPAITFDWQNMTNTYNSQSSLASRQAVGRLMQYCGWAVNMNYAPGGSGAYTMYLPYIMNESFGYAQGGKYADREDYNIEEWENLIYNELSNQRPIVYTGYTAAMEGHAFVCDGYDGDGKYHINWGWNGSYDGFFRLSLLNAGGTGTGGSTTSYTFSCSQGAVIGIGPQHPGELPINADRPTVERPVLVSSKVITRQNQSDNFTNITISHGLTYNTIDLDNYSWGNIEFIAGMAIYKDNQLISVKGQSTVSVALYRGGEYRPTFSFGAGLTDGTYTMLPVCKKNETDEWQPMIGTNHRYVEATISDNQMTLTVVPRCDFNVTKAAYDGNRYFRVELLNPSEEYDGLVYLHTFDGELLAYNQVAIPAYVEDKIDFYISDPSAIDANTIFTLSVNDDGSDYFYISATSQDANLALNVDITNSRQSDEPASSDVLEVYGNRIGVKVDASNTGTGVYRHIISLAVESDDGTVNEKVYNKVNEIKAKSLSTINIPVNVASKYKNKTLTVVASYYDGNNIATARSEKFRLIDGIVYWIADGTLRGCDFNKNLVVPEEATAIDLRKKNYSSVTPNSNPNTFYLLDNRSYDTLAGKNLVSANGGASRIRFVTGYDYCIPEEITVQQGVTLSHTFTADQYGKWQIIAPPFIPVGMFAADGETPIALVPSSTSNEGDVYMAINGGLTNDGRYQILLSNSFLTTIMPMFFSPRQHLLGSTITLESDKNLKLSPTDKPEYARGNVRMIAARGEYVADAWHYDNDAATPAVLSYSSSSVKTKGFGAYFVTTKDVSGNELEIKYPFDMSLGIEDSNILQKEETAPTFYNLQGQRVGNQQPSRRGIYIVGGKKIIVK